MLEMLRFIYTGKAPSLDKMAADLLAAADKVRIYIRVGLAYLLIMVSWCFDISKLLCTPEFILLAESKLLSFSSEFLKLYPFTHTHTHTVYMVMVSCPLDSVSIGPCLIMCKCIVLGQPETSHVLCNAVPPSLPHSLDLYFSVIFHYHRSRAQSRCLRLCAI